MKRLLIFTLAALIFCAASFAQSGRGRISGTVIGKNSHLPIEYSTVALRDGVTHTIITGVAADSLGRFSIQGIDYGTYDIQCSFIGFPDYISNVFTLSGNNRSIDFGDIQLDDSGEALNEAVLSAHRSTYVQTIDKKVFNVGSDIASASGSASDLLQNVPSLQVDIEGNVALRGNDNVQVLIDGKPSVMMKGVNRGTVLQQLPAASIERIEVITNPSAQFKPDGTSGIINLVMKKNRAKGLDGSVRANVGNTGRYNGGVTLGWMTERFGVNASYGYRVDRRDRWTDNNRTLTDLTTGTQTNVIQNTVSKARSTSHIGGLGVQWRPTKKDEFELSGNFTYMTFPRTEDNRMIQSVGSTTEKDFVRHRYDDERQQEAEAAAVYTHTFKEGKTLSVDYTYALQNEVENNHYTNIYSIPSTPQSADNTLIKQRNDENLVRVLYSNAINDRNTIAAGYEAELDKGDMRYFAEDLVGADWVKNTGKSNDFIFNESVHSIYGTWEHHINRFSFMAGVRAEQSYIKSNLLTLSKVVNDNYFMCYPTLHTAYKASDKSEFQLNYSLRVNRPEGDDLNPFPEYQDPYNIKAGNPYLKPEKIHSVELGWQYKQGHTTFIVTPYYRYTFNKMTQITKVLEGGVMETTKENLSSSSAAGAELILNSELGRWCNFNINSNIFHNTIDASALGYSASKSAFAWYLSANADFLFTKTFMMQLNARYNSSEITPQGKKKGTYIMNIGSRYDLPKLNLSFTATCSDVFDSYKSVLIVDTPTIQQCVQRRRAPRIFYLGVSYRFGHSGNGKHNNDIHYDETL